MSRDTPPRAEHPGPRIIPTLRYRDLSAAIDWLGRAFGFERHLVAPGPDGAPIHAQLVLDGSMVMVSTPRGDPFSELQKLPAEVGGIGTQSAYVIVDDLDAHHDRAVAAGADVVYPLCAAPVGRMYSCRDPEGHLWSFGTYDPWAPPPGS